MADKHLAIRQIEVAAGWSGHAAIYRMVTVSGYITYFAMDPTKAGAPIIWIAPHGQLEPTPYQTADARHLPFEAAVLVANHFDLREYGDEISDVSEAEVTN